MYRQDASPFGTLFLGLFRLILCLNYPKGCAISMRMTKKQPKTPYKQALQALDKSLVEGALKASGGNISEAARSLGVTRRTLYAKLEAYGI